MLSTVSRLAIPEWLTPELVVVDNASTDNTAAYVRALRLSNMTARLVNSPKPGVGDARNVGLQSAAGQILLITDDDTRLPSNWIEAMCAPILSGRADAVAGKVVIPPQLQRSWMEPLHRAILSSTECMDAERPQDMFGASMGFSRAVLSKVPLFDPELGT